MKKSETRLSRTVRMMSFISIVLLLCVPFAVTAATGPDIKRVYEGSLFKMTDNNLFGVEIMFMEKELRAGNNKAEIIIYDGSGNDVEDAAIAITATAPESGQGVTESPVVTEKGGGFYSVENIVLDAAGHWELKLDIKKEGVEDSVVFDFPEVRGAAEEVKTEDLAQDEKYRAMLKPLPAIPPIPPDNTMSPEKILLGKMLYWDRRVSKTGATSCSSCHHPSYYGAEPARKSVGVGGEMYLRNAPTVLNSAFMKELFWAGEASSLDDPAFNTVKAHTDMNNLPEEVTSALNRIDVYNGLSNRAFGGPLTEENIRKATAAFVRTLITPNYPLARWLQGDEGAITENQKNGMTLFVGKGCIGCHHGPAFSGQGHGPEGEAHENEVPESRTPAQHLHKVVVPGAENDHGLANKSKKEADKYFFKAPLLLNVAGTPPYSHAGLIDNLHDMVAFMAKSMLNIELSASEIGDIEAFLHSLTGEMPGDFMSVPALPAEIQGAVINDADTGKK